jgi:steroid delta-isomerase-like uncharacterized protein
MSLEENKAVIRRFVEEVQTQHNIDIMDELFSPDFYDHSSLSTTHTLNESKQFFAMCFSAFPDLRADIHDQIAEEDKVVTHKTFRGTHKGEFMGIPATGKRVSFDVIDIFRVTEGRIMEHWFEGDMMGLMQQLGAVPTPEK